MTANLLSKLYKVPESTLRNWKRQGVDIDAAPDVAKHVLGLTRRPKAWQSILDDDEGETLDSLKKRRLKADAERLELAAEIQRGKYFPAEDCYRIQDAWAAALKQGLAEMRGTLPEQLAGRDQADVAAALEECHRSLQEQLSDLESGLWREVLETQDVVA